MNSESVLKKIAELSATVEKTFDSLSTDFPQLLEVKKALANSGTDDNDFQSINSIQQMLSSVGSNSESADEGSADFFSGYSTKYSGLFATLNEQLDSLNTLNTRIDKIKSDSEEMELIALNAMVISIKSGESGRAFSCITENLKRLSGDMIMYSGRLIQEEKLLTDQISALQNTYTVITETQKSISHYANSGSAIITRIAATACTSLDSIVEMAKSIVPPIIAAMEGIQMQDIIRQSLDQVELCLKEVIPINYDVEETELFDSLSFNHTLTELSSAVITDVATNIKSSIDVFSKNWEDVHTILDHVEEARTAFLSEYLDKRGIGENNFIGRFDEIFSDFQSLIDEINRCQSIQKNMVAACTGISDEVQQLKTIFDNLRPVINKLGHVRISQQIEVAKNPAIASVRDTVTHMDELITNASVDLDFTRKEIELFVKNIDTLVESFSAESAKDNQLLTGIKQQKSRFFNYLKDFRTNLATRIENFSVYPPSFNASCKQVNDALIQLSGIYTEYTRLSSSLTNAANIAKEELNTKLRSAGLTDWVIHSDRLKTLIKHFTITAHKEHAGKIAGFVVEQGTEAGNVTLF